MVDVARQRLSHWTFAADKFATEATLAIDLVAGKSEVGEGDDNGEGERHKIHGVGCEECCEEAADWLERTKGRRPVVWLMWKVSLMLVDADSLGAGELVVCRPVFSSGQVTFLY